MRTIALLLLAGLARAESIELTRQQARELYSALLHIEPGLTAENVITAADNLSALRAPVEALDKGQIRAERDRLAVPKGDQQVALVVGIQAAFEAKCDEVIALDLKRFDVSADEIKAAKITPRDLAPLRQFLAKK